MPAQSAIAPASENDGSLWENPLGTDGFEFVEYASPNPQQLHDLFLRMGFTLVANHRSKQVRLYRQGDVNFVLNDEPGSFAAEFANTHGPSACAMAFRVNNAANAYRQVAERGATVIENHIGPMELNIPTIAGIGGIRVYMVDRYGSQGSIYDVDFNFLDGVDPHPTGAGLTYIDHLTHNVAMGDMDKWADFYERVFNFKEVRYFDIEGKLTGLRSKAMTSPCGKIRIPINESADEKGQIAEFLKLYNGEGIQHIALGTAAIHDSVEQMRGQGITFLETPATYYEAIPDRLPGHGENVQRLQADNILIDGAPTEGQGLLLQIFTETAIGPIFFELIQRKGNEGFGEGNFRALYLAMEEDQIRRGVLDDPQEG